MIQLDKNYSLEPDMFKGLVLCFREERERTNQKTKQKEMYTFEDKWYYPKLSQVLRKYLLLKQIECKSIDELIKLTEIVEQKINEL